MSVLRSAAFRARERTALGDITLRAAGRVAGRVTDPEGAPIAAQRIMLDPGGTEERALTFLTTDADGVFDGTLHAEGAHVVRFERDGFVPVGAFHGGGLSVTLEPGDVDAKIVLERATRTTFLVVDAITHEPLTEYWLSVTRGGGSEAEPRVHGGLPRQRARTHDGGRTERDAREAVDLVRAWAPGYLEFTGDVAHDSPGGGEQTVALVRGATIVGRVLVDGDPAAEVRVRVTDRPERRHAPAKETVTGIDGRFLIEGIRAGTQHVIADVRGDSLSGRTTVEVPRPTAEPVWLEAPDLHLERPGLGTVEGTVLLPPTVPADGLTVYWGHWADATPVPVRSDGTFTLEDVPEGPRELNVHGSEGLLADVQPTRIEVPRGGTVLTTIDAAGAGKGTLALTLHAPGVDLTEVGFFVRHGRTSENPEDRAPRRGLRIMERFDADGRAEASVRASGTVFIELHVGDGPAVVLHDQPILLQPGARVERTVRYTPSTLEIELPDAWLADGLDFEQLALWTEGQHEPVWRTRLVRDEAAWSAVTRIEDGRATLENVPVGRFRVALAAAGPEGWIRAPEDTTVDIRAGTRNRFTLPGPAPTD
ncbi:MAG: carboxypeptidase-like regulatory domain-containing protein [Planctomycetota bacterium]